MVSFFARPVRLFGNVAVVILCAVLFLTPFALRGARMSLSRMENNVKDWLPSDFPETKDLEWFGRHFNGEQFVLATWPGCTEDAPLLNLFVKKLKNELYIDFDEAVEALGSESNEALKARKLERLRARRVGDEHGLFTLADHASYYENWGGRGEKWLRGHGASWYFITPKGELYRWTGKPNLWDALFRAAMKAVRGANQANGELIATLGEPEENEFHRDPRRLGARFFGTIETGPEVLEQLTAEGGPLWPRMSDIADEDKPFKARKDALERLTGSLFGPAVAEDFSWQRDSFLTHLEAQSESTIGELPADWERRFDEFVQRLVKREYGGQKSGLINASPQHQSTHWEDLFADLEVKAPSRQTCVIVTLSPPGKRQIGRALGRPLMGNPPGKLIDLATNECQIKLSDLKLGGPPIDNVAIDEEGTITLFNLIGWSAVVGLGLSYLCFRSIRLTMMVFFVGGVSAVASLSMVWWCGASVDAVLMSMPSLVYVLGLAGAVHIVNYYQEALRSHGLEGAPERALADGWGPCTLAAFTTALGLLSLSTSNLMPIKKFGLYSAIGTMLTLTLLFTYLPAALQLWPSRSRKSDQSEERPTGLAYLVELFWVGVGQRVIKRHAIVSISCLLLLGVAGIGFRYTETSVQLMKMFDSDSKIIRDYTWLESNFGKLVPMELIVRVKPEMLEPSIAELAAADESEYDDAFKLNFLERMELAHRVQSAVEAVFGPAGKNVVGLGLSAATFAPDLPAPAPTTLLNPTRMGFRAKLEENRDEFLASDYLRIEPTANGDNELWRVSLRVGALNDVNYGEFLHDQKLVVEPILAAYRHREAVLRGIASVRNEDGTPKRVVGATIGVIGPAIGTSTATSGTAEEAGDIVEGIDQAQLFSSTFRDLMTVAGCKAGWIDPNNEQRTAEFFTSDKFAQILSGADCVLLVQDHPKLNLEFIQAAAKDAGTLFVDARDHHYELGVTGVKTAVEQDVPIQVVYTGVVPIVYKAQGTLLRSLGNSIGLAFVMIACVMMILLRDWRSRPGLTNIVNFPAGCISMVPNIFPVVLVFGAMGHMRIKVDIGTMMCASVAMGVAVDDTIHFLSWFRKGIRQGLDRNAAVIGAYRRVATAMTQTTIIGGLGLAVFSFSTFTPTQRFGVMMVTLLAAALIGDLILLPALLAGPLGKCFCPRSARRSVEAKSSREPFLAEPIEPRRAGSPRSQSSHIRTDPRHRR
jgi:predicted RND superfamily exporter protein